MQPLAWFVELKELSAVAEPAVIAHPGDGVEFELTDAFEKLDAAESGIRQHSDFEGSFEPLRQLPDKGQPQLSR